MRAINLRLCDTNFLADQDGNPAKMISQYEQDYNCSFSGSFLAASNLNVEAKCLETIGSIKVESSNQEYSKFRLTANYPATKKTQIYSIEADDLDLRIGSSVFNCENIESNECLISGIGFDAGVSIDNVYTNSGCSMSFISGTINSLSCLRGGMGSCTFYDSEFQVRGTGSSEDFFSVGRTYLVNCNITDNYSGLITFKSDPLDYYYWESSKVDGYNIQISPLVSADDENPNPQVVGGYAVGCDITARNSVSIINHDRVTGKISSPGVSMSNIAKLTSNLFLNCQYIYIRTKQEYEESDMPEGQTVSGQFIDTSINCQELSIYGNSIPYNYAIIKKPLNAEKIHLSNFINESDIVMQTGVLENGVNNGTIRGKKIKVENVTGTGVIIQDV